jgi:uncharacterized protein
VTVVEIGRVIGMERRPNTAYTFYFWTDVNASVGIGTLVKVVRDAPEGGEPQTVYGTVVEAFGFNDLESPLHEFLSVGGDASMVPPTERPEMRLFQAAVLRREPEEPIGAVPIAPVFMADEADVRRALRTDTYADSAGIPAGCYGPKDGPVAVHLHAEFLLGPESGHLNMTGTSGLAAKTSFILFLLKAIFERADTSVWAEEKGVAALLFNTKGGDLLYIDQEPLAGFLKDSDHALYQAAGVTPGPFQKVRFYAPFEKDGFNLSTLRRNFALEEGNPTRPFSFGLRDVIRHAEVLLTREDLDAKADAYLQYLNDRFVENPDGHQIGGQGEYRKAANLDELVEIVGDQLAYCEAQSQNGVDSHHPHTIRKMRNRLRGLGSRFGGLISERSDPTGPLEDGPFEPGTVYVVDVAALDSESQDLVFAAFVSGLKERMEQKKLGVGKLIVVVDELNKYAPSGGRDTYVLKSLREIAARGRYMGLTLFGAQQFRSRVDKEVVGNAATHAFGHIEAEELAQPGYGYFSPAVKEKLATLETGQVLLKHPHFAQPIFVRFPRPAVLKGGEGMTLYQREEPLSLGVILERELVRLKPASLNRCKDELNALSPEKENLLEVLRTLRRLQVGEDPIPALRRGRRLAPTQTVSDEPRQVIVERDPFASSS